MFAAEPAATAPGTHRATRADLSDGWGTLCGRFVDGPEKLLATNDNALVVEPATGGIKNILVYARKVSRIHPSYDSESVRSERKTLLEIKEHAFDPRVVALRLYELLTIRNRDPVAHVFLMRPPVGMESNLLLGPGDEVDRRFPDKQYFPVVVNCSLHPWMAAYVLVRDNPYFALTDSYGWFEIRDLPAGEEIELQVWHELGAGPRGGLAAKPQWSKGRLRVTIPRGGVLDLDTIVIAPAAFRLENRLDVSRTVRDTMPR
ncbi:MAG: hypothetical protein WD063_13505 [Pirellulales bacterium]